MSLFHSQMHKPAEGIPDVMDVPAPRNIACEVFFFTLTARMNASSARMKLLAAEGSFMLDFFFVSALLGQVRRREVARAGSGRLACYDASNLAMYCLYTCSLPKRICNPR